MQIAPQDEKIGHLEIPLAYLKNPRIMKVVQDSFGHLNEKYKPGLPQQNSSLHNKTSMLLTPASNIHYMFTGEQFIPVPMNVSVQSNIDPDLVGSSKASKIIFPKKSQISPSTTVFSKPRNAYPGCVPPPIPLKSNNNENKRQFTFNHPRNNSNTFEHEKSEYPEQNLKKKNYYLENGKNKKIAEKLPERNLFCTGTIERILRWNRNIKDIFCLFETIAPVVSLQEGRVAQQKIMLLRDKKGPILQVQYYTSTHIDINDFHMGQYLRCVGRMTGFNVLLAESIREAKEDEILTLARLSYVCDYSVTHNISDD